MERKLYAGLGVPAELLQNRRPFSLPTREEMRAREQQRYEEDARVFEALDRAGRFPPLWPEMEPVVSPSRPWTITETEGITIINSRVLPLVEALRASGDLPLSEDAEAALGQTVRQVRTLPARPTSSSRPVPALSWPAMSSRSRARE